MALTDANGGGLSAADIAAVMGNNGNNNGFGFGNDGAWWILILLLFGCFGSWGNNNNNGFVPYMMGNQQGSDVQRVVDQQSIMNGIAGINSAMATNFSNAEISRCNSQANILQALNNNQMGLYQTLNANQNASTQGMNNLAMSLQNCCCENRAATADLKYTVATEACADRNAVQAAAQQLSNTYAQGNQAILDKLCQLEMDGIKQNYENRIYGMQNTIDQLRAQQNESNRLASQTAQTAQILADNAAQTAALENYLNPPARPAYVVQNPNCCAPQWNNCGCACGA